MTPIEDDVNSTDAPEASPKIESPSYRSSSAGRWLPRFLAGCSIISGALVSSRFPAGEGMGDGLRLFFLIMGAALGWYLMRGGSDLKLEIRLEADRLWISGGGEGKTVRYDDLSRLEFESPFAGSRWRWVPSTSLIDRHGLAWRVPATLVEGDAAIVEIVRRADDNELQSWCEALNIPARMSRQLWIVRIGYGIGILLIALAWVFAQRAAAGQLT